MRNARHDLPAGESRSFVRASACAAVLGFAALLAAASTDAADVPHGFVEELVLDGGHSDIRGIYGMQFAPDGRMFLGEWRRGWLRVMTYDRDSGQWTLQPEPFHRFHTPDSNPDSPTARRGTLRCFTFDPDFETNRIIYATYMNDADRRGYRIVRIRQSKEDPNRSDGREETLLVCPFFFDGAQPDAHNGGGIIVGGDGKLYVSFGDGWREEMATDLRGFAGKVVRLNRDGTIPRDNIWYGTLEGDLRAIVGVGQRNPTCLSRHPVSGEVYINGFTGPNKSSMFRLKQGLHYGHGGSCPLGEPAKEWINTRLTNFDKGGTMWACWYPAGGLWPEEYWHNAFITNWMVNGGEIIRVAGDEQRPRKLPFADDLLYMGGDGVNIGPVVAEIGPDGQMYYTVREYGEYTDLRRIRYVGKEAAGGLASTGNASAPSRVRNSSTGSAVSGEELAAHMAALGDGDAARGRTIFIEDDGLACLKCHKYKNLGGDVGPPLTEIGAKRSREQILEAILYPSKAIEEAYVQKSILTDDGKLVTGRVEQESDEQLVLVTAEGRRVFVPRASIEAVQRAQSAMPEDYAKRLSPTDLRDLVEFLARTGPATESESPASH